VHPEFADDHGQRPLHNVNPRRPSRRPLRPGRGPQPAAGPHAM